MNHILNGMVRALTETFSLPEPILEIGSHQVAGQEAIAELRSFFPGKSYLGVDCRPGPGVDQVADVESLPFADGSIGTVVAMNTLEHVPRYWRGLAEICRVLRRDGALLLSCPFYFKIHHYPEDFWRFSPRALEMLLEDYPTRILGWHGPRSRPAHVWALAFRAENPAVNPISFDRYRQLLGRYAREPLPWFRRWRYRLGSWLFGRRPFLPFLEQNNWETTWQTANLPEPSTVGPISNRSWFPSALPTGIAGTCSKAVWKP